MAADQNICLKFIITFARISEVNPYSIGKMDQDG